jgi:hypothetical protein
MPRSSVGSTSAQLVMRWIGYGSMYHPAIFRAIVHLSSLWFWPSRRREDLRCRQSPYDSSELTQTIRTLLHGPVRLPKSPSPVNHICNNTLRWSVAGVQPIATLASTSFVHVRFHAPSSMRCGNVPRLSPSLTPLQADTSSDRSTRRQWLLPATRWLRMHRRP